MQMVALCAAQCLADDVDAWGLPRLRALLPVAGMTVIEHQAERARAAGISSILLLVDAVPPGLADACDRIRRRGVDVRLVRDGDEVVRDCAAAARIVLVADGLIAGDAAWQMVVAEAGALILTTADGPMAGGLERIDGETRWAGLAIIDRDMLDALAGADAGWDPQLVLFRSAVQAGLPTRRCDSALFVSGEMAVAESPQEAAGAAEQMMVRHSVAETGIFARWVGAPALQLMSGALLQRQSSGSTARVATLLLAVGAAGFALAALPVAMGVCGLAAAVAHQAATFVARFRPESAGWVWMGRVGLAAQLLAIIIADRGVRAVGLDDWHWGSGGMTLSLMLIVGLLLPRRLLIGQGRLVDPALAWMAAAVAVPVIGGRAGFDLVGACAGMVMILSLLFPADARRAEPAA